MTNILNTKAIIHYLHLTIILIVLAMATALTINLVSTISSWVAVNFVGVQMTKFVMGNLIEMIMEYGLECVAGLCTLKMIHA